MKGPPPQHEEEDDEDGELFLDEADIVGEFPVDEEDLPDADDDEASSDDADIDEEPDDSVHIFTGHTGEVYTVACSPMDASLVATGGGDDKGFLWRIGHGDWAFELQGMSKATDRIKFHMARPDPSWKIIVCCSGLHMSQIHLLYLVTGHGDSICCLAFSTDGRLLASGCLGGLIKIWDIPSQNLKFSLDGPGEGIEWIRWHPRGHLVLAGSEDSIVWMWNADKGACLNTFSGHGGSVTCGDFTPDGKVVCTGSDDATLRIWDPKSGKNIHVVGGHAYHTEGLTCMAISSDSTLALTGSKDGSVGFVNITSGRVVSMLHSHSDSIECVGFAPSSGASSLWAATGGMDQKLIIWDLQHSIPRSTCEHEDGVTCLTWIGASSYVATGCVDGKVRVWDSRSGVCARTFSGHTGAIQSLSVSPNHDFLISVSLDETARVFEIAEFR